MDITKICLIGIAGIIFAIFLRTHKPEYSVLISMVVCVLIFVFMLDKLEVVIGYIESVRSLIGIDDRFLTMILKMLGITYIAQFSSDFCKDAGYQAIAGQIEMFAKLSIMLVSMPVLMSLIETVGEFL